MFISGALDQCYGRSYQVNSRIVNGISTNISQLPYQLQIENKNRLICGATLLKPNYAISAAHCFNGLTKSDVTVRAGTSDQNVGGVVVRVSKIIIHESFDHQSHDYDIAILKLVQNLNLGPNVQTIDIIGEEPAEGTTATVSGWGQLYEGGPTAHDLRSISISVRNKKNCSANYAPFRITERMFCAGVEGKDTCHGDSGGPLVISGKLAGVTSLGKGCANATYPGVYVNVAELAFWILENISEDIVLRKLFEKMNDVVKTVESLNDQHREIAQKNEKQMNGINDEMTQLTKRISEGNEKIKNLEIENFDLQAKLTVNSVEIHMPEMANENVYDVVVKVAKVLGVQNVTSDDISVARRVLSRNDKSKSYITVQFILRKKWKQFLETAIKGETKVYLSDIFPKAANQDRRVFVFELMSPKHKQLFQSCVDKAELHGFNYVGYTDGKIYVKRNKADNNVITISYPHELSKIDTVVTVRTHNSQQLVQAPNLTTLQWMHV